MNLLTQLESAGFSRRRTVQDFIILSGSFLLFLWIAYEFSLFGKVADEVLDRGRRIDFYEALAAGGLLFCSLWIFALRRARELRTEIARRNNAETRALEADFRARHDPLTGLGNRAHFDEDLAELTGETTSGALLLLDLNGFKKVNDAFGHPFGDEILRIVAQRLRTHTREGDRICRLGGDEFAIVILAKGEAESDLGRAETIARTVIRALDAPIRFDGQTVIIGVAIGIACSSAGTGDSVTLVAAADKALYTAKEESRLQHRSGYAIGELVAFGDETDDPRPGDGRA